MKNKKFILGVLVGILLTIFINIQFKDEPMDFKIIQEEDYELFFEQSLERPVLVLGDYRTRVYFREKIPNISKFHSWNFIGEVFLDPFDLDEVQIEKKGIDMKIIFPWENAKISSKDLKSWETNYH